MATASEYGLRAAIFTLFIALVVGGIGFVAVTTVQDIAHAVQETHDECTNAPEAVACKQAT